MQFFKTFVSTLLIASPMAFAAPATETVELAANPEVDSLIAKLVNVIELQEAEEANEVPAVKAREIEARQGWTCAFVGGNKGCQVKCFLMGKGGGYCNSKNVCICH